jgi:hypothetical protein
VFFFFKSFLFLKPKNNNSNVAKEEGEESGDIDYLVYED